MMFCKEKKKSKCVQKKSISAASPISSKIVMTNKNEGKIVIVENEDKNKNEEEDE